MTDETSRDIAYKLIPKNLQADLREELVDLFEEALNSYGQNQSDLTGIIYEKELQLAEKRIGQLEAVCKELIKVLRPYATAESERIISKATEILEKK